MYAQFVLHASAEAVALTTCGEVQVCATENLERAMLPTERLGGHLVSAHVGGVGRLRGIVDDARAQRWAFDAPAPLHRYIARKGSICVDGVSLTVNAIDDSGFEVALIPHTIEHTAFAQAKAGDAVNLEKIGRAHV